MNVNAYAKQYRQTAVTSAVLDASPHRLISLMLAGVRERVRLAAACLERRDIVRKVHVINEACTIVDSLHSSLDMEAGGEIAQNLAALYDYAMRRMIEANASNDAAPLHEVDALLGEVESAWNAIDPAVTPAPRAAGAAA